MSESHNERHPINKQAALRRLADELGQLDTTALPETVGDKEMLSLIVEEVNKGVDISIRYPDFYQKLLNHRELRQAFLDVLQSIEDEEENEPIPWAEDASVDLLFLTEEPAQPIIKKLANQWQVSWQRTTEQLQRILSPSALAYRGDPSISDDQWFTLLREEIEIQNSIYTVVLECTFSEEDEKAFSPYLNIAVTVGATTDHPQFPVQTSLHWGAYDQTLRIAEEGRARFPDISFQIIFDDKLTHIDAELQLTLQPLT